MIATSGFLTALECTKSIFGGAPDPAGGAYSAPTDPLAGFKGSYFYSKGGEGREGKGEGKEGKGGEGRGREGGEGKGRRGCPPPQLQLLDPPLSDQDVLQPLGKALCCVFMTSISNMFVRFELVVISWRSWSALCIFAPGLCAFLPRCV